MRVLAVVPERPGSVGERPLNAERGVVQALRLQSGEEERDGAAGVGAGHGGAVHQLAAAEGEVRHGGDGAAGRAHRHAAVAVHRGPARRPRVGSTRHLGQ